MPKLGKDSFTIFNYKYCLWFIFEISNIKVLVIKPKICLIATRYPAFS